LDVENTTEQFVDSRCWKPMSRASITCS